MQGVNILYLMLGWVLGIFSPFIVDEVKRHCQKRSLKKAYLLNLKMSGIDYLVRCICYAHDLGHIIEIY